MGTLVGTFTRVSCLDETRSSGSSAKRITVQIACSSMNRRVATCLYKRARVSNVRSVIDPGWRSPAGCAFAAIPAEASEHGSLPGEGASTNTLGPHGQAAAVDSCTVDVPIVLADAMWAIPCVSSDRGAPLTRVMASSPKQWSDSGLRCRESARQRDPIPLEQPAANGLKMPLSGTISTTPVTMSRPRSQHIEKGAVTARCPSSSAATSRPAGLRADRPEGSCGAAR